MATRRAKQLVLSQTTSTLDTYATCPADTKWELTELLLYISGGAARLFVGKIGGVFWWQESVPANTAVRRQFFTVVDAGQTIQIQGHSSLYVVLCGIEVAPLT